MSNTDPLSNKRQAIDAIDAQIQTLLQQRTLIVEDVAAYKAAQAADVYMRPGREANVIRTLMQRHQGSMDKTVLYRLWREIMMASLQVEKAFSVAMLQQTWQHARDHFGGVTPTHLCEQPNQALRLLHENKCLLAVMPDFANDSQGEAPWWVNLVRQGKGALRFVFKLPFLASTTASPCYVIGPVTSEATGDDATVIGLDAKASLNRNKLKSILEQHNLTSHRTALWRSDDQSRVYLLELAGHLNHQTLALLQQSLADDIYQCVPLGHYAMPMASTQANTQAR